MATWTECIEIENEGMCMSERIEMRRRGAREKQQII